MIKLILLIHTDSLKDSIFSDNFFLSILVFLSISLMFFVYKFFKKWKNSFTVEHNNIFNRCDYILYIFYVFCVGNETREDTKGQGVIGLQILLHKKPPKRKKEIS